MRFIPTVSTPAFPDTSFHPRWLSASSSWTAEGTEEQEEMMRVLVTGSRHWDRYDLIEACLDEVARDRGVITIVHGGARGADRLAGLWARRYGHRVEVHPADWDRWGRSAGIRRNQAMVATNPDLVIAFRAPGTSRGTDHCIQAAQRAGLPVMVVTP